MSRLPINPSLRLDPVKEGVFVHRRMFGPDVYLKVYNDLHNSDAYCMGRLDYGRFNGFVYAAENEPDLVKRVANVYCQLRDSGFYHSGTLFMAGDDASGHPSLIALMHGLMQCGLSDMDNLDVKDNLQDFIGCWPCPDTWFSHNYGMDRKGNVYLMDLHVFMDTPYERLGFNLQR